MALVIENAQAESLVRQLADLRSESTEKALLHALEADLASELSRRVSAPIQKKTPEEIEAGVAHLMALAEQVTSDPGFKRYTKEEIDDWLYDENGLPH